MHDGSISSGFARQDTTFLFSSDDGTTPNGQSYEFRVGSTTAIAITGNSDTAANTFTSIVFTLDRPTAWTLAEASSLGGNNNSGGDLQFWGALLFTGQPQFIDLGASIIPEIQEVYENGGLASGMLEPGTYTYIVSSGGNDNVDTQEVQIGTDFTLTEVPEPLTTLPFFAGALALIRRR